MIQWLAHWKAKLKDVEPKNTRLCAIVSTQRFGFNIRSVLSAWHLFICQPKWTRASCNTIPFYVHSMLKIICKLLFHANILAKPKKIVTLNHNTKALCVYSIIIRYIGVFYLRLYCPTIDTNPISRKYIYKVTLENVEEKYSIGPKTKINDS